ncbi:MAG: adenylyl-sulfate kinase [Treponema sp.]|nr:adenylyl-sulfate kinase [Treponema sp.]
MELLKFITCGSVDDGKSTLIGHLLYDSKLLYADQEKALELDSKIGSNDGKIDYSLLLDGLMAEREQGITIDVAYRYFTTKNRSFVVADCPGHEQYTRNMAVGASFADLAVLLVDATKGLLTQTRRHSLICAFMGLRHVVLAVNKMDMVHYNRSVYEDIKRDFDGLCGSLNIKSIAIIPLSATEGDNITTHSAKTPWYTGKTLLNCLETFDVSSTKTDSDFAMCVQRVCRPHKDFRGFMGEIDTGSIGIGDTIRTLPGNTIAKISGIQSAGKDAREASAGEAVTLLLDREIDISRGNVIFSDSPNQQVQYANLFSVDLLWMDDTVLNAGAGYLLKCGTKTVPATILKLKNKIDVNTGKKIAADFVTKNDIVSCEILTGESIAFTPFEQNKTLGGFILIDRISNMTSACGTIRFALRRSQNLTWQDTDITREARAKLMNQKPLTLWLTGLSGSGKSTLANALEKRLASLGRHTMLLDGDNIRLGINKDLGFTKKDRSENIRRLAEIAKLMNDAGLIVLTAFISPFKVDRETAREIIGNDNFLEIYVNTPIEECEKRDVKGLYKKARAGELPEFTGVSGVYEAPENPALSVNTAELSVEEAVEKILAVI